MISPDNFFNKENDLYKGIFGTKEYVWEGLSSIPKYIDENIKPNLDSIETTYPVVTKTKKLDNGAVIHAGSYLMGNNIELGENCVIEPGALIKEPAIIGANTEIRQCAYIRGNVIIGRDCVLGHASEMKNSVMLGKSKAGHFAYIGDSILGEVNLGAGTKIANLKITNTKITIKVKNKKYNTGLRKFGAIMADNSETGCNSVLSPGTIISKNVLIYPNTTARGYYPPNSVVKLRQNTKTKQLS